MIKLRNVLSFHDKNIMIGELRQLGNASIGNYDPKELAITLSKKTGLKLTRFNIIYGIKALGYKTKSQIARSGPIAESGLTSKLTAIENKLDILIALLK